MLILMTVILTLGSVAGYVLLDRLVPLDRLLAAGGLSMLPGFGLALLFQKLLRPATVSSARPFLRFIGLLSVMFFLGGAATASKLLTVS